MDHGWEKDAGALDLVEGTCSLLASESASRSRLYRACSKKKKVRRESLDDKTGEAGPTTGPFEP